MDYAKYIDHTFLKPEGTTEDVEKLIDEGLEYGFKTVCISPAFVEYAKEKIGSEDLGICTVIGFPSGATTTESKIFEAKDAIDKGADEIDMVINIGKVKERDFDYLVEEINAVKNTCQKRVLKVIIETALLDEEEIKFASKAVLEGNADFVKTSTGFSTRGASFRDVELIKSVIGDKIQIKASGGIRTKEDFLKYLEMGVTRIGASAGVKLIK